MAGEKLRAESERPEPRAARRTADPVSRPTRPSTFMHASVLGLQRAVGNRAVARKFTVAQPKLTVGPASDRFEQEADRVADTVMRNLPTEDAGPGAVPDDAYLGRIVVGRIGRTGEPSNTIGPDGGDPGRDTEGQLRRARGGGATLPPAIRVSMERAMGADFGDVRVHADTQTDVLSRSMQARAFTAGRDIFFARSQFRPGTASGQRLLAHELTHTLQQGGTRLHRDVTQRMLVQRMAVKIENKGEAKEFEQAKPLVRQFTTEEPIDFATADFSGLTAAEPLVIWSHADGYNVGGKVGGALADELYKQGLRTCAELRILGCNHAGHPHLILGFLKAGFKKFSDLGRFPMYATTGQLHWTNLDTGEHLPVENWWVALETEEERGQKGEHKGALKQLRAKWKRKLDSYRQERETLYKAAKERGETTVTTTYYGKTLTYPIEEFLEKHGALEDEGDETKAAEQVEALEKKQEKARFGLRKGLYKEDRYPTIGSPPSGGRGGWKDAADAEAFAVDEKKKKKPWAPWVRDWSRDL